MRDSSKAPVPALAAFDFSKLALPAQDYSNWAFSSSDFSTSDLASFDLPRQLVVPLLWYFRQFNTAADALYYDVGLLWLRLFTRGVVVTTSTATAPAAIEDRAAALEAAAKFLNLSALANPEGAILAIDAHHRPFIEKYDDVTRFLESGLKFPSQDDAASSPREIQIITVTGVGSSALGSAAFAWNVSEALRQPVAAIVPGYGLADLIPQALGGWFGFGLEDFMRRQVQLLLAQAAPEMAKLGRRLWLSAPQAADIADPVFRRGSPESDVLHQIVEAAPQIKRLYGHSKGALCIQNAVRDLPRDRYRDLHITTLGCVIGEETDADYNQILGDIDGLGQLNSWGNWPEKWIRSWHSTNSMLPLTMPVAELVKQDVRDEDPVEIDPGQLQTAVKEALKAVLPLSLINP